VGGGWWVGAWGGSKYSFLNMETAMPDASSEPSAEPSPTTLASLPDECLRHVLSLLSLCALGSTARTCRSLRDLAAEPSLWRQLLAVVWNAAPPAGGDARSARRAFVDRLAVYRRLADLRMAVSGPASKFLDACIARADGGGDAATAPPVAPGAGASDAPAGASEPSAQPFENENIRAHMCPSSSSEAAANSGAPGYSGPPANSFVPDYSGPAAMSDGPSARLVQELRWTGQAEETHGDHTVGVACLPEPLPYWPAGVPTRYAFHSAPNYPPLAHPFQNL
jgi:hypothetical protein